MENVPFLFIFPVPTPLPVERGEKFRLVPLDLAISSRKLALPFPIPLIVIRYASVQ